MRLEPAILREIGTVVASGPVEAVEFASIASDSRAVRPGALFVAVRGATVDGHRFIPDAVRAGAVLIVREDADPGCAVPWVRVHDSRAALGRLEAWVRGDPTRRLLLIGVTGTDGKTSTAMLIEAGVAACGLAAGLIGSVVYRMPGFQERAPMTTPDPGRLQDLFARMARDGVRAAVMEVSSHALDQRRVEGCAFSVAVFTNLTRDHLDYHRTPEAYAAAKMRLFEEVLPASPHARGAVIAADDPLAPEIRRRCPLPVTGFSLRSGGADISPIESRLTLDGIEAEVRTPWGVFPIRSRLIGAHNLMNLMAALGAGGVAGLPLDRFAEGLCAVDRIPGRLERVAGRRPVRVFVDYAHTPKAIENVLRALRPLVGCSRLTIVFGAGGDRDRGKRPLMGRAAVTLADHVVITSDNPRTENPMEIIAAIVRGAEEAAREGSVACWTVIPDRREAIGAAIRGSGEGDVVLVAGKGHESEQVVGTTRLPFVDAEVAQGFLNE